MARHVGGMILQISLASLAFFFIIFTGYIYLGADQGILKPVIQSVIATLIFSVGFAFLKRKK